MDHDHFARLGDLAGGYVVGEERVWRLPPSVGGTAGPTIVLSRWRCTAAGEARTQARADAAHYVVEIVLRKTRVHLQVDDVTVLDGVAMPGCIHVTRPGAKAVARYGGAADLLHLHVPAELVENPATGAVAAIDRGGRCFYDPVIRQLAGTILQAEAGAIPLGQRYTGSVCAAILARLMDASGDAAADRRGVSALCKWRLRRVLDFVEANLQDVITLTDLATAAGLTRMHFAARFKAATGLRPHDYVVQRRIEQAQTLLREPGAAIVDVALTVGFQTQAHFTTVFRRLVGQPPQMWRKSQDDLPPASWHPARIPALLDHAAPL